MTEPQSELLPQSEDIRLACAFIADADKRADVLVLYAWLETLRAIPERVSDPLLGEIRLRWWSEAIEEIMTGQTPRYHPLIEAIQRLINQYELQPQAFLDVIDGQTPLLGRQPLDIRTALGVVDSGDGGVAKLAASIIDRKLPEALLAARFYGLAKLKAAGHLPEAGETEYAHLKREAMTSAKRLPAEIMPMALPAVLAPDIWHGKASGPLSKRLRLLWAFVTGRL